LSTSSTVKQDRLFLKARRGGMSCRDIARRFGVKSVKTVYNGIERARLLERPAGTEHGKTPTLVPMYPLTPLTPRSTCPHLGPLRKGSCFYCEICGKSGCDHMPIFRRHPLTDPKPERKVRPKPAPKLTRKQKRSIMEHLKPANN
jgi:hypothetical protein